jgi:hypothetical protein
LQLTSFSRKPFKKVDFHPFNELSNRFSTFSFYCNFGQVSKSDISAH